MKDEGKGMIYTIGYGNRKIKEFIEILKHYNINYLVDVRSRPFSKYNPAYSKNNLKEHLDNAGIVYVFMGDQIGGMPDDDTCYTAGKIDYDILKEKDYFKNGIERLKTAEGKNLTLALMCGEISPEPCHRSRLIGAVLQEYGIKVIHIIDAEETKTQDTVMYNINNGQESLDFSNGE